MNLLRGLAGMRSAVKSGDVGRTQSYSRDGVRLNYYPSTRYVAISMDHPSQDTDVAQGAVDEEPQSLQSI